MKTPDEIKKGLECCTNDAFDCSERCPYFNPTSNGVDCASQLHTDALALIRQLERERDEAMQERDGLSIMLTSAESAFEKMKRERDAAVTDLAENRRCENCKHFTPGYFCLGCRRGDQWEWRGMQEGEQ